MRAGVPQQFGPPEQIYAAPANTFVAGFIGPPAMNLLEGVVVDGKFRVEELSIPLPGAPARNAGRLIVGVRPEHARIDMDRAVELHVEVVEALRGRSSSTDRSAPMCLSWSAWIPVCIRARAIR